MHYSWERQLDITCDDGHKGGWGFKRDGRNKTILFCCLPASAQTALCMMDAMMCLQLLGCRTCAKNILAETKHFHLSSMGDYAKEMGNSVQNEKALKKK